MPGFIHDKLEIKFLILYITARVIEPIPFDTVWDLAMCDEGVDYFDFAECLSDLVRTEHLTLSADGLYAITDKGLRNSRICVLRLGIGDEITLTDGKGHFYKAEITVATNKRCLVAIKETIFQEPLWPCHLHIAMAPTKNMDRNEWVAEKATEIGFDELTFLNCRFSERKVIKTERIEKILISAIKQSLKARLPKLNEMTDFDKFIAQEFQGQKFIAHCYEGEKPQLKNVLKAGEDALVLIGPEGDFSEEEVKKAIECGFTPISLGKSRLRTETAALVACHTMNLLNQ